MMMRAPDCGPACGLAEFDIPKRAGLRVDKSWVPARIWTCLPGGNSGKYTDKKFTGACDEETDEKQPRHDGAV
jgi:hypothetical protein